jgi:hypothetical protein
VVPAGRCRRARPGGRAARRVGLRVQMAVAVPGEAHRGMPGPGRDLLGVGAGRDPQGDRRVPQVVDAQPVQPSGVRGHGRRRTGPATVPLRSRSLSPRRSRGRPRPRPGRPRAGPSHPGGCRRGPADVWRRRPGPGAGRPWWWSSGGSWSTSGPGTPACAPTPAT